MIDTIQVSDPLKIANAIAHLSRGGEDCAGLLEVFRAVYAKRIACALVHDPKLPIDDIPLDARRAAGWRCARGLVGWSKATIVHAAAAAEMVKPGTPGCLVWPRGDVHPVAPPRETLQ